MGKVSEFVCKGWLGVRMFKVGECELWQTGQARILGHGLSYSGAGNVCLPILPWHFFAGSSAAGFCKSDPWGISSPYAGSSNGEKTEAEIQSRVETFPEVGAILQWCKL